MLPNYSTEDATQAYCHSKNLNSAIKKFLKEAGSQNPAALRLVKELREIVKRDTGKPTQASTSTAKMQSFIERNFEGNRDLFLVLARSAYAAQTEEVIDRIIQRFAEQFNTTFNLEGENLQVKDTARFKELGSQALDTIYIMVKDKELAGAPFLAHAVAYSIFEPLVLKELLNGRTSKSQEAENRV